MNKEKMIRLACKTYDDIPLLLDAKHAAGNKKIKDDLLDIRYQLAEDTNQAELAKENCKLFENKYDIKIVICLIAGYILLGVGFWLSMPVLMVISLVLVSLFFAFASFMLRSVFSRREKAEQNLLKTLLFYEKNALNRPEFRDPITDRSFIPRALNVLQSEFTTQTVDQAYLQSMLRSIETANS